MPSLQEKDHFIRILAPLFVKDLENPQFLNSGAKLEILWGYKCGAKIYGVKVEFIENVTYGVNEYVAFHGVWCKTPKPNLGGLKFCGVKHQN